MIFLISDLTNEELFLKEEICYKLLALVSQLQGGECRMRGLFLNELALTKEERARRSADSKKVLILFYSTTNFLIPDSFSSFENVEIKSNFQLFGWFSIIK